MNETNSSEVKSHDSNGISLPETGTLSIEEIVRRLDPRKSVYGENRIIVTPMLDPCDQIGSSGIDLRLGKQFIVFKSHLQESLNPAQVGETVPGIFKYQEEYVVEMKGKIILHPGQLILGSTFEYIGIPGDLEARVDGRSSWSRMGLIIATAMTIHPHYHGVLTLELSNQGTIPMELYPGLKIAFMTFSVLSSPVPAKEDESKYACSVGPGFSKIYKDKHKKHFIPE